jgi:pSer/pThr/pTyr-binding forkhead associated (FHA) protein
MSYKLIVEGNIPVLYKNEWMKEIPLDCEEISVGVMDPDNNIFPDINLRQYRLEGGDPYISRKHARFFKEDDKWYIEDLCRNNSTSVGNKLEIINGIRQELTPGMRIFISESIAFRFEEGEITEESPQERLNEQSTSATNFLEVSGLIPLYFKPQNLFISTIDLNPEEWDKDQDGLPAIQFGRRSTEDKIYPDVDLWKFYFNDGDEYIARRHARIYYKDNKFYFQDLSGKGSTWYNQKDEDHRLLHNENNPAIHEIQDGDTLIISDSAVFTAHIAKANSNTEAKEQEE